MLVFLDDELDYENLRHNLGSIWPCCTLVFGVVGLSIEN